MVFWGRWLSNLEQYDYTIVHRKGTRHVSADASSCVPIKKCPRTDCPHCMMKICKVTAQQPADDTDGWWGVGVGGVGVSNQDILDWQWPEL